MGTNLPPLNDMLEFTLYFVCWNLYRCLQARPVVGPIGCLTLRIVSFLDTVTESALYYVVLAVLLIEGLKLHLLD